jgi:hypothetical protein
MTQAMSDPTVRVRHFTTPTALLTTAEGKTCPTDQDWNYSPKGKGKSKREAEIKSYKGKGKGSAKADVKLLKTPDTIPSARGTIAPEDARCLSAKQCTGATVASEGTLVSTGCAQTGCSEGVLTPKLKAIYFFA